MRKVEGLEFCGLRSRVCPEMRVSDFAWLLTRKPHEGVAFWLLPTGRLLDLHFLLLLLREGLLRLCRPAGFLSARRILVPTSPPCRSEILN